MQMYKHSFFVPGAIVNVAMHNPVTHTFATCVGRELSVWSDSTGKKKLELPKAFAVDATAMCFDDRKRKLLVGAHDGTITVLNCLNGAVMKEADVPHRAEVTSLTYHVRDRNVVSTSRDGSITVHNEEPQDSLEHLRHVDRAHDGECSCGHVSEELAYIATGGADGVVRVWQYESCDLLVELVPKLEGNHSCATDETREQMTATEGQSRPNGPKARSKGVAGSVGPPIMSV